jgi:hypothetical protein
MIDNARNTNGYSWISLVYPSGNYYITVSTLVTCLILPGREVRQDFKKGSQ